MRQSFIAFAPAGPKPPAPNGTSWEALMELAIAEAKKAAQLGEVPVGAVFVGENGQILARAGNRVEKRRDPTAHAEILVLRKAGGLLGNQRLGGTLVCTLEPCLMCAGAIIQARVAGVVFGAADARAGAIISTMDLTDLPAARSIWHLGGVLSAKCASLLRAFFAGRRPEPCASRQNSQNAATATRQKD